MSSRTWIFLLLFVSLLLPQPVRADLRATLLSPSAGTDGTWEIIQLSFRWPYNTPGGGEAGEDLAITLQDARGGPVFARTLVPSIRNTASMAGDLIDVLIPFPLLAPSDLPRGQWPIRASVEAGGKRLEEAELVLSRMEGASDRDFRIVIPARTGAGTAGGGDPQPMWSRLTDRPLVALAMGREDILTGSPLLFAGCDALLVTPSLRGELTEARALALFNVGVRLVLAGDLPNTGGLAGLVWDRVSPPPGSTALSEDGTVSTWVCPPEPFRRPAVVEPALARLPAVRVDAPASVRWILLLLAPAAVLLVVLARGIFRRPLVTLAAAALALAGLTIGAVMGLQAGARAGPAAPATESAWEVTMAPQSGTSGAYTCAETLGLDRPLFARDLHLFDTESALLLPVAASARDYFRLRDARITLESPSARGLERLTRLDLRVPARQEIAWLTRRLRLGFDGATGTGGERGEGRTSALIPSLPRTDDERRRFTEMTGVRLDSGVWIEGGYVVPAPGNSDSPPRELFTTWARRQGAPIEKRAAQGAVAWYELRFDAAHTYFCRMTDPALRLIDFGPPAAGPP
jgi:hypothetical protein